jgi:hypothetical protein
LAGEAYVFDKPIRWMLHPANPRERRGCEVTQAQQLIKQRDLVAAMWPNKRKMWIHAALQTMQDQQQEIALLRSRIDNAPVAIMDTRTELGLCAPTEEAFEGLYAIQGHRVALIDLGVAK